ncbi:MAG: hypothetical protein DMG76_35280 [Acidobacteria bacterium]|nr:MAG: hypothetical protein DMG76_35280 [Acidobacteriota bacterium]
MRAWSVLRQLLAATLCAVLALPACSNTAPLSSSTPSHIYDAETLSKTRVWGSNQKNLLHIRATLLVSEKQHWGYEQCRWENVVGSGVTYDYDAFGNLIHSTGSTPNNYLYSGEQFDSDLNLYYNRARYLNVSTGRFWSMDSYEGDPGAPLSLHKYLYASADSIDRTDPSGNLELTEALGALAVASVIFNLASLTYHLHQTFTANTPREQAIATTLVYTDTLGLFLSLVGGGFVGPTSSLAASGGATIAVASVSETAIIGSIAIPGAANLIYFSSTSGGAGSGSGGGGGSGGVGVKDAHVDVPKHNLNKLAPTYAEQKQLLIDAVEKITNAEKLGSNADGEAFEATVDLINSAGKPVTTTIRWFRYTDGTRTINTAFVPPATP